MKRWTNHIKFNYHKKRTFKRIVSFTLVLALLVTGLPMDIMNFVSEDLAKKTGLELTVKAAEVDSALLSKYSATSYTFTSNHTYTQDGVTYSFAEYSKCFQDATWADDHKEDILTLNPDGTFIFDASYNPIGNVSAPFNGTIILNTNASEFTVQTSAPIFEYVKDSVTIRKISTGENIPISINRVADVGDTVSALFANHVVGPSAESPYEWKVTLDSNSAHSYSGVIYEMSDGAKVNLTFTDNSTHTPQLNSDQEIVSGSIINNKQNNANYGILCGKVLGGSVLQTFYTCADTTNAVTFIGTEIAYCGGLIGEINGSTFELLTGSSAMKIDFKTAKDHVGFICGHAEDSTITLPTGYVFSGTIDGNQYAGGIAGYCKNTAVNFESASGNSSITLSNCTIKNGSTTGGVFGYYECDAAEKDILLTRTYGLTECKVEGTGLSGGIAGEYKVTYSGNVTIDIDDYSMDGTTQLKTGTSAGGLFGKYTANGSVTITDSYITNTHFAPPSSSVPFGGIIGEYVNNSYDNTLALNNFTVNNLNCTSTGMVGGVIGTLTGSTYVSVSDVYVTNATANSATYFGGIISTLDNNNAGSFIDVTGNYTLSMASGTSYKGGAIAGSFKTGVIRLAGTTDISGAKAANGYAQLVYENDETLVYAKGSGSDAGWTLIRNSGTTASDLGQWGEVVRMFDVNGTDKNAEDAGIVSVANNKVTVASVTADPAINDEASFAKVALNMQLNDGSDHGALCFASGGANKTSLLSSNITLSGEIGLSGTGLLGLMRDIKTNDIFTGKIIGESGQTNKITLAVGENYGDGTGGNIYLSYGNGSNGHNAQGLFAYSQSATVSNLTVDGTMNINRSGIGDSLYAGAVSGYVTGGISLNTVTANPVIYFNSTKNDQNVYIGGVAGIYDDNKTATGFTVSVSAITPTINISGNNALTTAHRYGGVLGYLNGSNDTAYDFTIENSTLTPVITIANESTQQSEAYIGGLIAMVGNGKQQTITIQNTNITNANISTKSLYAGGLLGHRWENVNVSIGGLNITGSAVSNTYSNAANNGGLVFASHGVWDVESISIDATSSFTTSSGNSFGLLVNEGYRSATNNNNGLYLKVKNSGLNYASGINVTEAANMDEICVKTADNEDKVVSGGDSVGVISIDMNTGINTETKVTETGTYQNKITAFADKKPNSLSRYYYGLQLMKENAEATGGEQFLLWSVRNYASGNIKNMFKDSDGMIASTDIDLSGLSYYPIALGNVTLPSSATVTFGFNDVKSVESDSSYNTDSYSRNPDDTGNARNQHYLMQTGLFTTVSSLTANTLTLTGDFGYVSGAASGALINKSTSGTVSLTRLTLDGLKPSSADSYMLINSIDGTGTATPTLTVSNLCATGYGTGVTLPVAKSLFGTATGQNMTMTFSEIKLDARIPRDTNVTYTGLTNDESESLDTALNLAYGTSRSLFSTATFFSILQAAKTSNMKYDYSVEEDWGYVDDQDQTKGYKRYVTYGKEVTDSQEYSGAEKNYMLVGETYGHFTNPISDSDNEFDFTVGFLPYVGNYTTKGDSNITYPVREIKVNYKAPGLTVGCGTYNDPYIITSHDQLVTIAKTINGESSGYPSVIRLPNVYNADHVITSWHDDNIGDGIYNHSGTSYARTDNTTGIMDWDEKRVRYYLASAYYKIEGNLVLPDDFPGIGVPNDANNTNKGNTVFHGVIVGDSQSKPTITIPNGNPLIMVANGAVVKNVNIKVTGTVTREQTETGSNALYGYNGSSTDAKYYGAVIGEIMGGDNIIDDVIVTYTDPTTLGGTYSYIIAEGGMVGCVVNGALIFRGSNSVIGRNVSGGGIYSNPIVGRVINGYAIYEKIEGREGAAPVNSDYYHIDTIVRKDTDKLDVNYTDATVTVPDAQALYIMSLITQSIAGTAKTDGNNDYDEYSPSYGYKSYLNGVARLGDYSDVGCGSDKAKAGYADYNNYAFLDSVNNYTDNSNKGGLMWAPIPYIIYKYTERHGTTANKPALDFPARKMTSDNTKFWDITLSKSDTFASMDSFKAFRGIGSVGVLTKNVTDDSGKGARVSMKVATFNGNGNTIKLHISLPRYGKSIENYYHLQPQSITQVYNGWDLDHGGNKYASDDGTNIKKLMGLGLFDSVLVKNDNSHEYQFNNFTLQGTVEDKVYNSSGEDITGKDKEGQLFCVGGVVGKRVNGNNYDINFKDIIFDGLTVTGSFNCGGLIGHDAILNSKQMKIEGCNSTENGISVIGGHFDEYSKDSDKFRNGIGSLVGMTFHCRPYIDGKTATSDVSEIRVDRVTTFYEEDTGGVNVGGLIGYSGTGAEIKNIKLIGANQNSVIGAPNALNAAGFIGFAQPRDNNQSNDGSTQCIILDNCTLYHLSVQAKRSAAGLYGRSWNSNWSVKYIRINNCAVIGEKGKHEIRAYGTGDDDTHDCVGGFISGCAGSHNNDFSIIQNSYIEGYAIEGHNVGGIIGRTTFKPAYLKNLYVKDCDIIINKNSGGSEGGIVGYSEQNLSGYNLATYNVNFLKRSDETTTVDNTANAGFILGGNNDNNKIDKFVGIGAYHATDSKVPSNVVMSNGTNNSNFFVFADYTNTSLSDINAETGYASSFGVTVDNTVADTTNNIPYPSAPYVNTSPHTVMGTNEYITGDGASIGKAGEIYKDIKTGTSNRRYAIGSTAVTDSSVGNITDATTLANYINDNGSYKNGVFKISTASAEFGTLPEGVNNFAMLVINDDAEKANEITPFIKSYIRLVTNAEKSSNQYKNNQYAYSYGSNNINILYKVVVRPCYYDSDEGKFVLGDEEDSALRITSSGTYVFDSTKADSKAGNYQFSLVDVQFKDPTSTTGKIAYHLYVPVYTKKMLAAEFSAVSMSETKYYRTPYATKIASELQTGKSAANASQLVESTNEWTTTFIRFTYPKNQITSNDNWNYDKSIKITIDSNFQALPVGTKFVLVDPNANADKFYTYELNSDWISGEHTLNFSDFIVNGSNPVENFAPQNLSAILADNSASNGDELYEDYYISMYVPKAGDGFTHSMKIGCGTEMTDSTSTYKANIESKLYSLVVLGDLFSHEITNFDVKSGDGTTFADNLEMTEENKVLKTDVTATVQIKNQSAGAYLANSNVYHAFFISLTSHDAEQKVSDIIYGITPRYISNTTTYSIPGGIENNVTNSYLGANYIRLDTGGIINLLMASNSTPVVTIHSVTYMTFNDITAFPYNINGAEGIGTQVSIKSNLAYREEELLFSALNVLEEDPAGSFYYSTTRNNAELSFNAVPIDDTTDEIGYKTNNRSLLGVNGKYGMSHPIIGKTMYNVEDIVDYESATAVQYTVELYKKVTDNSGTSYQKVNNISNYMSGVNMVDESGEVTLEADRTTNTDKYVYTGTIDHDNALDNDKMFEATFSCNVLTGDATHNEYANYKIYITATLENASNSWKDAYLIYTNAKIDPTVIDETD